MESLFYFEYFDPKDGKVPEYFSDQFENIAKRARKLLEHRSGKEIRSAAELVEWLLHAPAVREYHFATLVRDAEALERGETVISELTSDAATLAYCVENVALDGTDDLPNVSWTELFAALSLGLIGEAREHEHRLQTAKRKEDDPLYYRMIGPYAAEAMEAVCIGECLQGKEQTVDQQLITQEAKKLFSIRQQQAAYGRHRTRNELVREFIRYWENGHFPSRAEAARRFYASLPKEKRYFKPTNAVRTLTAALSKYLSDNTLP